MAEDRFSKQSAAYARYRPEYPPELFEYLSSLAPAHDLAWDCATGNGQAARSLAKHFKRVVATDLSGEQISNAHGPSNVQFEVLPAEAPAVAEQSADIITVAQAVHWFDLNVFYDIVRKSLKAGGVLAVWGYGFFKITPELDEILDPYGLQTLGPYWSQRNQLIIDGYRDLDFPFERLKVPQFEIKVIWNLDHLKGYLDSWSATQKFKDQNGSNPYDAIASRVASLWGEPTKTREVTFAITLRVGRKS